MGQPAGLKIIHSNTDGYKSKKESINEIAASEKPDILTLNDTNLKGNLKVKVPGYFSYNKNRDKHKGGVATVIANHLVHNTMKVAEGTDEDEYIITRIDKTIPAVNIVNIYGTQESRSTKDDIDKSWYNLMKDIKDIEGRKEAVIILGDMNRHVRSGEYGIQGNKNYISYGGQYIRKLIQDRQYILINNLDIVQGGPWTWQDRKDVMRKSCLDLCIISISLLPYVHSVVVDKDLKFTPRRVVKTKKQTKSIFSDHFALKVELKGMPKKQEQEKQGTMWKLNNPGGWETYKSLTDKAAADIEEAIDTESDINNVIKKINAIETKIKFKSFGKTKVSIHKVKKDVKCLNSCKLSSCNQCKTQQQKDEELIKKDKAD